MPSPDVTTTQPPNPGAPVPVPVPYPNQGGPVGGSIPIGQKGPTFPGPHPTVSQPTTTTKSVTSKYIGETEKNPRLKSGSDSGGHGSGPGPSGGGGHHK